MKTCTQCHLELSLDSFLSDKTHKDGLASLCRSCRCVNKRKAWAARHEKPLEWQERDRQQRRRATRKHMKTATGITAEKMKVRKKTRNAIWRGKLQRLPCAVCGDPKSEAHHEDYSKPLDVIFLCNFHHRLTHGRVPDWELKARSMDKAEI